MEFLNTTTAPMLGEIGASETPTENVDIGSSQGEKPQQQPKKQRSDFSYKLANLARKESLLLEQKKALEGDLSLANEYKSSKELAKKNPIKLLQSLGLSFEDIARFQLEGENGEAAPEDPISSLKSQIEEMKKSTLEKEEREQQRLIEQEKANHDAQISSFKKTIDTFVESNKDDFEFLNANKEHIDTVYSVIEKHYNHTQKVLDFKEACQLVEEELESEFKTKYSSLKKIRALINPEDQKDMQTEPLSFLKESKYEVSRPTSLSNQIKPESPVRLDENNLTAEQRFERAVKMLEQGRRG